jgi:hypothetical protein
LPALTHTSPRADLDDRSAGNGVFAGPKFTVDVAGTLWPFQYASEPAIHGVGTHRSSKAVATLTDTLYGILGVEEEQPDLARLEQPMRTNDLHL